MRQHDKPATAPKDGYPWFRVQVTEDEHWHFRVPDIIAGQRVYTYYAGCQQMLARVLAQYESLSKGAQDADPDVVASKMSALAAQAEDASAQATGATGFVLIEAWADPHRELVAQTAWRHRSALRPHVRALGSSDEGKRDAARVALGAFDPDVVQAATMARELEVEHETDSRTAHGMVALREMQEDGLALHEVKSIADGVARLVCQNVANPDGNEVKILADF